MKNNLVDYINHFMEMVNIPIEARDELLCAADTINIDSNTLKLFTDSKIELMNRQAGFMNVLDRIGQLDKKLGIHKYTLHFIFLVSCTDILFERYKNRHIDESIFWDGMDDFRCKLIECHDIMDVWGIFVADWYEYWIDMDIFALGRFQYEEIMYKWESYSKGKIAVNKGDLVHRLHIPSSGKPFDREARHESYSKAYDFYGYGERGENMVVVCSSWMLYPELKSMLSPDSRIRDFMDDFDIISCRATDVFEDDWRIFGKHHKLPYEKLPRDTSLQKAIANYMQSGGKMGIGFGVLVYDGENIRRDI